MLRLLFLPGLALALAGCAPSYHCDKFPTGSCKNMSQVYSATGAGFHDYREAGTANSKDRRKAAPAIVIGPAVKGLNELQPGDPVLTRPQALRVWVRPWQDKDRDLNYSYIYVRTKDSEWTALQ